ncbi:uncharacterized protein LOC118275758 [Spodoptera frugiperda]|uniref:Cystathionine beta-synthase n=1 Tax=Spodoptera frugiperda TaxID=7108 RepID=A0A9R0DQP8_SPOFR|nr:uncharacterized protein LOC118275758 [Spodoptera frugiperda]
MNVKHNEPGKAIYNSILEVIGHTPLVKLNRIPKDHGLQCQMYAKCEYINPGGSIKDRIAHTMIQEAEYEGKIHPGVTRLVEPTSGNTGIGVSLVAAVKGYKCTIVTPDKNSDEKMSTMNLLGAEIIQTPSNIHHQDPGSFMSVTRQILEEDPNAYSLDQYSNRYNPLTHHEHTAVEILDALENVDMFVMGTGTGGTVTGTGKKLKEKCPGCTIVTVDPAGSIIFEEGPQFPFFVEGIGGDFVPDVLDKHVIDKVIKPDDYDAFNMSRELIQKEGLLCGGSSGAITYAAIQAAKERKLGPDQKVVVILPDGIRNYMTKFVNDQWMEAHLFKPIPKRDFPWWTRCISNLNIIRTVPMIRDSSSCLETLTAMDTKHNIAFIVNEDGLLKGVISKDSLRAAATNPKCKTPLDFHDKAIKHVLKKHHKIIENKENATVGLAARILDIAPFVAVVEEYKNGNNNNPGLDLQKAYEIANKQQNKQQGLVRTGHRPHPAVAVVRFSYFCDRLNKQNKKMSNHVEENSTENVVRKFFNLKEMPHIVKPLDRNQKTHPHILNAIGNTPLVKLSKIPKEEGIKCDMYAKCEFLNPGGSVKDRIAYRMVLDAEEKGILKPGKSVIVEPTSGNTGIGLALASAVRGYRCIIVLPEKMSDEKVNTLIALGAEIIRTPTEAAWNDPTSNLMVAHRLSKEIPDAVLLDQYNNPCNPLAHYDGTAEEILWSLDDDVDMVVMGAGTSGTVSGVGHKIKERCPKCIVVGVDPYGSILAQPEELNKSDVQVYEVEGIGYDFLPASLDRGVIDKWIKSEDHASLAMARRLIKDEGLLCGGSSGSAMWGAIQAAKSLKEGQKCVVLLPDNIRNYMTKFISDQWMEARNFQPLVVKEHLPWWSKPVTENMVQSIKSVSQDSSPSQALATLKESGAPVLSVVNDKGSVIGVFTADNARKRLVNLSGSLTESLEKFTVKKFYKVDLAHKPTLGLVSRMLDIAPHVVVVKTDASTHIESPVGVFTSENLLTSISTESKIMNGS